jgi:hypothetical protein
MAWFRRSRDPATAPRPTVDPALGDPDAVRLREAMARGDWPAVRDFLTGVTDPDDHACYVDVASRVPGAEAWLPRIVGGRRHDVLALTLAGARAVDWAWEARTAKLARDVGREQFEAFFERLKIAEEYLLEAVRHDPGATTAWCTLITVARGRNLGIAEARRRFDQVVVRHPGHVRAHGQLLQQLCHKWGGSHEAMHEFARESMMKVPAGSPLGYLVALGHLEHWSQLDRDEDTRYIRADAVRAELHEAADRSVRHSAYRRRPGWPVAHNAFAMAFSLAGEQRAAAEQFAVIGSVVTQVPWCYLNGRGPTAAFLASREAAHRAAQGVY